MRKMPYKLYKKAYATVWGYSNNNSPSLGEPLEHNVLFIYYLKRGSEQQWASSVNRVQQPSICTEERSSVVLHKQCGLQTICFTTASVLSYSKTLQRIMAEYTLSAYYLNVNPCISLVQVGSYILNSKSVDNMWCRIPLYHSILACCYQRSIRTHLLRF